MGSLTPEQRREALKLFQESPCDCGRTIAVCRLEDSDCSRSPELAASVIRLMAEGKTVDQAATAVFYRAGANEMVYDVPVGDSFFDGPEGATVTLITFLGYQCPYSVRVHPTLQRLRQEFGNNLRVVYKQRPLRNHYWSMVASEAVLAAGAQGRFLEMSLLLFARQEEIEDLLNSKAIKMNRPTLDQDVQRELFIDFAAELGLDVDRVRRELEDRIYKAQIEAESAQAVRVGAKGTPSSFVNGRYIRGAKPFELFRREVQKEIDWARTDSRPIFPTGTDVAQERAAVSAPKPAPKSAPTPKRAAVQAEEKVLVFDVPVGKTFSIGPPDAPVTLISFLDYQ
jgi:protein-disulfide isomerase